jgi:hypothetical protein
LIGLAGVKVPFPEDSYLWEKEWNSGPEWHRVRLELRQHTGEAMAMLRGLLTELFERRRQATKNT